MNSVTPVDKSARLEEARKKKATRDEEAKAKAVDAELEALDAEEKEYDLEKTLANKLNGKRGIDFEIVKTDLGLFAVRKPEFVVAKKYLTAKENGPEERIHFVVPCLEFPDSGEAKDVFKNHGGVADRLVLALLALYQGMAVDQRGKF